MTKNFLKNRHLVIFINFFLAISLFSEHAAATQMEDSDPMKKMIHLSIWDLIEKIDKSQPIQFSGLESILHLRMIEDPSTSQYTLFWETDGFGLNEKPITYLRDGIHINGILLGIDPQRRNHSSQLTIHIGGSCITKEMVQIHYTGVTLLSLPTGHSINEETKYRASIPSGRITFGFSERSSNCLSSISFGPND